MARHGENIRKRKDGRWEGRYLVYSEEKSKQIYRSVYGRSYEEVREKLTIQKNLLKNPPGQAAAKNHTVSGHIMLADAAQEWLAQVRDKRKPSTYVKYSLIFHNHLEKAFQDTALSEITDVLVKENIPEHLSDSTYKSIYCVLNQILKFASDHYCTTISNIKKPASDVRNKSIKLLARNEQKKLIGVLYREMDIFKMAVLLCLFTGLRLGELCALKWDDIDFDNKILMVNRTVQRIYVQGYETKTTLLEMMPKSECSRREIPLTAAAIEPLIKFQNNKEYIFGGDKPLEPRTLQNHFKKILKEAGLADKNFHVLRHTFSTNCIEGGTDVKSLSEILGHSDVQITLNRYVHPSMDTKRRHMDILSSFYGQIYGQAG